jgi:hypothetical protein
VIGHDATFGVSAVDNSSAMGEERIDPPAKAHVNGYSRNSRFN